MVQKRKNMYSLQEKCKFKHSAFNLNLYMEEFLYCAKSSKSAGIQQVGLPQMREGSGARKDA